MSGEKISCCLLLVLPQLVWLVDSERVGSGGVIHLIGVIHRGGGGRVIHLVGVIHRGVGGRGGGVIHLVHG